jgi:4'-phosphopantetheinyl transferase
MGGFEIGPGEVQCWIFQPARFVVDELAAVLSADERGRAKRFVFDRDRMEFVVCRGVLRHLLSQYGGGSASGLQFEYSARGKPALAAQSGVRIQFNVAHSRGAGLIGVTCGSAVGVDIERMDRFERVAALVPTCFAAEEQAEFASIPERMQPRAFYAGWTRKEAFVKATGEGLSRPLHSFAVTVAPDACPRLLRCNSDPASTAAWTIADLAGGDGFAAAVAVPAREAAITARNLFPQFLGLKPA